MKVIVLAVCVLAISISLANHTKSGIPCVLVHGKCHIREVLINGLDRPYQLSYSHHNHTLYFSYNTHRGVHKIGYVKGKQNFPTIVHEAVNGFATAIDQKNNIVYFGGAKGILKYDPLKPKHAHFIINGTDIWDMFFKDHLYFINYPELRLHKYIGENKTELQDKIHEEIYQFVIDGDNDTFITNKTGLYMIKNNTDHRILFEGASIFRAIEVNNKGVAYFCGQNDIFIAHKHNHTLEKVLPVPNIFGIAFNDQDAIIYSDPHQIVKLEPEHSIINETSKIIQKVGMHVDKAIKV